MIPPCLILMIPTLGGYNELSSIINQNKMNTFGNSKFKLFLLKDNRFNVLSVFPKVFTEHVHCNSNVDELNSVLVLNTVTCSFMNMIRCGLP